MYDVVFGTERLRREFVKALEKTPKQDQERIINAVEKLEDDPRPPGKSFRYLKGDIIIFSHIPHYRIRIGNYRVFYDIDDKAKKVYVIALRRRSESTYD